MTGLGAAPQALVKQLLAVLRRDADRLERIDDYVHGRYDDSYMPAPSDGECRLLAKRAVSNWMPLPVGIPAQARYVGSFGRGSATASSSARSVAVTPEWRHWQQSRLDVRRVAVHKGALTYGLAYTLTETAPNDVRAFRPQ